MQPEFIAASPTAVRPIVEAGMDAEGLSSLLLLAPASNGGTALLLTRAGEAMLQNGVGEISSTAVVRGDWAELSLPAGSFERVVVDLDAYQGDERARRRLIGCVRRWLQPRGCCVIVSAHRRRPRNRRDFLKYRLTAPLRRWLRLCEEEQLVIRRTAMLDFDGSRLIEMRTPVPLDHVMSSRASGDAVAMVLSPENTPSDNSIVEDIQQLVTDAIGATTTLDRLLVRKIGKTAAFVHSGATRCVARIGRSSVAVTRAARNYQTLEGLWSGDTFDDLVRHVVPRPIWSGRIGGYAVFVEELRPGQPRHQSGGAAVQWERRSLDYLTRLHRTSAARATLGGTVYDALVEHRIRMIEAEVENTTEREALASLATVLRQNLHGRVLPLVRSHGDFTNENCLYSDSGSLTGVIDWELSSPSALPLLDFIQAMDIANESSAHPRWQRADLVLDAVEGRGALSTAPELYEYAAAVGIDRTMLPMLLLMHWVDHVSCRIAARKTDVAWMQRRVHQPLERIAQITRRILGPQCGSPATAVS